MALADTAALVASLELQDKFSANAKKYENTLGRMERQTSSLGRIGGQVSQGVGTAVGNLQRLAVVGVGVLGANVAAGIASLVRLEEVTAATNAVIESTGGVAGISAEKVRDLAEEYENLNATMDDKVIQSAENVLLTFTAIGEEAFPLALEAALNLNQALGGGEEGLQGTIIQVGKALQDPIRGITALRRVGVSFTTAQEKQIKALVEQNRLYEAQQLILNELAVQFGGQFAAAGDTAAGKFAKLRDTIEDTQMALATAFLPVLTKVSDKLTTFLADPEVQQAIADFGEDAAAAFEDLIAVAEKLPWDSIGNAFKLMGTGAKAVLDTFVSMPPWVQTAILTAWGTNKLTGGMLGNIVSTLASGLIKGVLGINAGVVNINAATVTGGVGTGTPTGGAGGRLGTFAAGALGTAGLAAALAGFDLVLQDIFHGEERDRERAGAALTTPLGLIGRAFEEAFGDPLDDLIQGQNGMLNEQQAQTAAIQVENRRLQRSVEDGTGGVRREVITGEQGRRRQAQEESAAAARLLQSQAAANVKLQQIANKDFSPTVNVSTHVTSNVTISDIQRRITSQQIAIGRGPLEFE